MQRVINKLTTASMLAFSALGIFYGGKIISHTTKKGYLSTHQLGRSLLLTGGLTVALYIVQIFISIKRMNDNYRESNRWS